MDFKNPSVYNYFALFPLDTYDRYAQNNINILPSGWGIDPTLTDIYQTVYVNTDLRYVVWTVRGTSNINDVMHDISLFISDSRYETSAYFNTVIDIIKKYDDSYKIIFSSHSLGGTIQQAILLICFRLLTDAKTLNKLYYSKNFKDFDKRLIAVFSFNPGKAFMTSEKVLDLTLFQPIKFLTGIDINYNIDESIKPYIKSINHIYVTTDFDILSHFNKESDTSTIIVVPRKISGFGESHNILNFVSDDAIKKYDLNIYANLIETKSDMPPISEEQTLRQIESYKQMILTEDPSTIIDGIRNLYINGYELNDILQYIGQNNRIIDEESLMVIEESVIRPQDIAIKNTLQKIKRSFTLKPPPTSTPKPNLEDVRSYQEMLIDEDSQEYLKRLRYAEKRGDQTEIMRLIEERNLRVEHIRKYGKIPPYLPPKAPGGYKTVAPTQTPTQRPLIKGVIPKEEQSEKIKEAEEEGLIHGNIEDELKEWKDYLQHHQDSEKNKKSLKELQETLNNIEQSMDLGSFLKGIDLIQTLDSEIIRPAQRPMIKKITQKEYHEPIVLPAPSIPVASNANAVTIYKPPIIINRKYKEPQVIDMNVPLGQPELLQRKTVFKAPVKKEKVIKDVDGRVIQRQIIEETAEHRQEDIKLKKVSGQKRAPVKKAVKDIPGADLNPNPVQPMSAPKKRGRPANKPIEKKLVAPEGKEELKKIEAERKKLEKLRDEFLKKLKQI